MGLLNRIFGSAKNGDDEPLEEQKKDFLKSTVSPESINNKCCDQIPGAYGSFGTTPTNPIPVNGIIGEIVYMSSLRSKTGVGFYYHRLGSLSSPPSNNPIDEYELVAGDASEWRNLFFDCYYPRRSIKVPDGLTRTPWNSLNDTLKVLFKLPCGGANIKINNFPIGLPDVIQSSKQLNSFSPGLGAEMANRIRSKLREYEGKWERDEVHFKKEPVDKVTGSQTIQSNFAEYSAVLWHLFVEDYEDIKSTFDFKNEPDNFNGLMNFAFFLDIAKNLPTLLTKNNTKEIQDDIYRFVKVTVNAIPGLIEKFGEDKIRRATERIMVYTQLLNDDLKNSDPRNDQSVHEFLKELFSGQITEEEKVVLTNMLTRKLTPVMELIFMKDHDADDIKSHEVREVKQTANDYYKRGMECYSSDNYDQALKYFYQVLRMKPDSPRVNYYIADIYDREEDYDKSLIFINKEISLNPTWDAPYALRGGLNIEFKQYDSAISDFSKAIELNPKGTTSYFNRSLAYENKGHFRNARRDILFVLKTDPSDQEAQDKLQKLNEMIQKNTKEVGTRELGDRYFKLFVFLKTKRLFDQNEFIEDLRIHKSTDSERELNILNIFSVVHHIGRTSLGTDIKDSIINNTVNSYLNFLIEVANKDEIDEEIKLCEIEKTEALIPKRIKQYSAILKKYETSVLKKDKTDDNLIEIEIGNDLITLLGNITSYEYSEKDIFPAMRFFSFFMELMMDKFTESIINIDVSVFNIKNSELADEMQESKENDFVITKQDNGMISIKRK